MTLSGMRQSCSVSVPYCKVVEKASRRTCSAQRQSGLEVSSRCVLANALEPGSRIVLEVQNILIATWRAKRATNQLTR
jgi:hypothetical protein